MSKEEYANLYYLLGKLKYFYAKMSVNSNLKNIDDFEKLSQKINDILRYVPIDNEKD